MQFYKLGCEDPELRNYQHIKIWHVCAQMLNSSIRLLRTCLKVPPENSFHTYIPTKTNYPPESCQTAYPHSWIPSAKSLEYLWPPLWILEHHKVILFQSCTNILRYVCSLLRNHMYILHVTFFFQLKQFIKMYPDNSALYSPMVHRT